MGKKSLGSMSNTKQIDAYIGRHKEWWQIGKLKNFVDQISKLAHNPALQQYFSLAIGKLRKKLKDEEFKKDVAGLTAKRKLEEFKNSNKRELGDIFGAPQFFRYGEAGRSKKKPGCRVINKKK